MKDLVRIIEALLFVADGPLSGEQIQEAVPEASQAEIEEALDELRTSLGNGDRGVSLYSVGGGSQILTRPEFSPWVERLLAGRRRQRLSRAALEVLAIVAYRQPATRGEIETIRGVDCGATLHTLLERKLIAIKGRAKAVGHPLLYATSATFLEHFGLDDLRGLPKLEEFAALLDREEARAELRRSGLLPEAGESPAGDGDEVTPAAGVGTAGGPATPAAPGEWSDRDEIACPAERDGDGFGEAPGTAKSIEDSPGGELLPATEDTRDWSCDGSA